MPRPTRPETSVLVQERLERDANDLDALFVLAAMRTQTGKVDEGLSILERVLVMDPSYPGAWFFKEKLHKMRGERTQAESAHVRGEAADP